MAESRRTILTTNAAFAGARRDKSMLARPIGAAVSAVAGSTKAAVSLSPFSRSRWTIVRIESPGDESTGNRTKSSGFAGAITLDELVFFAGRFDVCAAAE